ncbi:MAG: hypothetical protein KAS32_19430 [Candidatus Peribacteraceae bacterium]|nr:hypothetical protein [Candidatus Peribacteraceae bacterium]
MPDIDLLIEMFLVVSLVSMLLCLYFQNEKINILKAIRDEDKDVIEANIKIIEEMLRWHREAANERTDVASVLVRHLKDEHDIDVVGKSKQGINPGQKQGVN